MTKVDLNLEHLLLLMPKEAIDTLHKAFYTAAPASEIPAETKSTKNKKKEEPVNFEDMLEETDLSLDEVGF